MIKVWGSMFAALGLVVASPAGAQAIMREGFEFLKAVRDRDGAKVNEMLAKPGTTIVHSRDVGTGENALHIATARRDAPWMRFLLQKGINPGVAKRDGTTALQIAARLGFEEGVEILLNAGAPPDVGDAAGETPLISAVHRRDIASVKALVAKGADPSRTDNSGRSARDYALLQGERNPVLVVLDEAVVARAAKAAEYGPR